MSLKEGGGLERDFSLGVLMLCITLLLEGRWAVGEDVWGVSEGWLWVSHRELWGMTTAHVVLCEVGRLIYFILFYFSWRLSMIPCMIMFLVGNDTWEYFEPFPSWGELPTKFMGSNQTHSFSLRQRKISGRVGNFLMLLFFCWEPENLIDQGSCYLLLRSVGEIPFSTSYRQLSTIVTACVPWVSDK